MAEFRQYKGEPENSISQRGQQVIALLNGMPDSAVLMHSAISIQQAPEATLERMLIVAETLDPDKGEVFLGGLAESLFRHLVEDGQEESGVAPRDYLDKDGIEAGYRFLRSILEARQKVRESISSEVSNE